MGYLLKEALKTLCGVNQWSYAAFWKIGCQNTKLLIWEECYYEPVLSLVSSEDSGIRTSLREWEGCLIAPHHDVQARERIELLINQMMMKNQISIVGEGIIGRAAFTGNHEWILSESYNGDSHPPEVLNEMQHQFSSGMKTVAVIPVSPHGVVQLGSSLSIMENAGFVNEVRNMIIQLGFIPGVLFSDGYESKSSLEIPNHDNFKQINSSSSCSSAFQVSNGILTPGVSLGRSCYPELSELVTSDVDMLLSQHAASLSHRGDFAEKRDNLEGVPLFRKTDQISNSRNTDKERLKNKNMLVGEILPSWIDEVEEHDNGRSQSIITNVKYEEPSFEQYSSFGDDLFDIFGEDLKNKILGGNFANLAESSSKKNPDGDFPSHSIGQSFLGNNDLDGDHLLDAVVTKAQSASKQCSEDNISCKTSLTKISSSSAPSGSPAYQKVNSSDRIGMETRIYPEKIAAPVSCSPSNSFYSSQISSWVEQSHSMKVESSVSTAYSKKQQDGSMKPNRKRTKPGENPRPRPKDRQMIQDRVKELREIVPNASKCSIDALLERTIKHMLFLQSVTKHADKLKESGQTKIMNKDGGVAMKDNLEGGATWAFEVGSQSMVCPIIVEDLNPPRQMLVEMLCEDRGFFLEIADIVRGLGLTILKGVMEARNGKIWARFAVEANRDVTRMEIFMSLVSLLEQTVGGPSAAKAVQSLAQPGTVRPN